MTSAAPTAAGALRAPEAESAIPPSSRASIDAAVDTLRSRKVAWASLPLLEKIDLLRRLRKSFAAVAEAWVAACQRAEGIPGDSPRGSEEWIAGPYFVLRNLRLLQASLTSLSVHGAPRIPGPVRQRPDGRTTAEVFPCDLYDRLFYPGVTGEVWLQPGVTPETIARHQAVAYREELPRGKVALVLSAGNVSSIGPMDALYKLFVDNEVVVFKTHRVNDYLGPLLERGLRPLVEAGFLRVVYGGAEEGAYLCEHPLVDSIHITGSDKTYDAIVFGTGAEGARRKAAGEPRLQKPVSAELGNVSPVIVVPGTWSDADLAYQAENVATMLANNAGFNCNAARVLVLHRGWSQREAFLAAVRDVLRQVPPRRAYYPGAADRFAALVAAHPDSVLIGEPGEGELPWGMALDLDPEKRDDVAFTTEAFCSFFGAVPLPAAGAVDFVRQAVAFCNGTLWGTLNATMIVHPDSAAEPELGAAVEQAIADLRYGTVSVNHWAAIGYGLVVTPWGAYPGHPPQDIRSGVGVVHNTLMFSDVEKGVVRAPFRARPKPPWFVLHRASHELLRKLTYFEAAPAPWKLPAIFALALQG
ncbi:MAG TPA: aldehyde dehydrogenase family protein [Thermoanaerobaculia bacterium]|nr:aldehyde dehydrogenase family protein [Thermoanaerobaculia bacterium]